MTIMQRFRRFARARGGLAALEFAILLPMMVFLLFGAVELIDVLGANRRVENTASSLADVVSRDTEVTDDEVDGLWAALGLLMTPDNPATLNIRITSVSVENATTARVVWSEGRNMAPRPANSTVTLPNGIMRPGTSIIMAEAEYLYTWPLGLVMSGTMTLEHTVYRRSRLIDPIPRET
ncbi:MAG: pilus assembly protein [Hyphomonadaceae bacterium]|nr:pilus assembly protein [Hyphomonadaceae bacterium]